MTNAEGARAKALDADEIYRRLRFYAATEVQRDVYERIRALTIEYVTDVASLLPESREKSHWLTVVEDAQMWANKAIALNGVRVPDVESGFEVI